MRRGRAGKLPGVAEPAGADARVRDAGGSGMTSGTWRVTEGYVGCLKGSKPLNLVYL